MAASSDSHNCLSQEACICLITPSCMQICHGHVGDSITQAVCLPASTAAGSIPHSHHKTAPKAARIVVQREAKELATLRSWCTSSCHAHPPTSRRVSGRVSQPDMGCRLPCHEPSTTTSDVQTSGGDVELGEAGLELAGARLDGGQRLQLVVQDAHRLGQRRVRRPQRRRRTFIDVRNKVTQLIAAGG